MPTPQDRPEDRPKNREVENEDLRPAGDGQPPRPATAPPGSKASQRSPKLDSDAGSGEPTSK